jgi:MFS family permease
VSLRRHPDFLRLWAGETISVIGSQVTLLAVPFIAITLLHASTFEVGLLTAVETLPFLLVGLPAGAVIDRVRRRPVMIVADLGRAAALTSIPIAHAFDVLTMAQLYAVVLVTGVLTVFFDVAYQAYLPSVVARDQLVEGNAKLAMSQSAAQVAGPGLAGGLVGLIGAVAAIWADAASFVLSALALLGIRHRESRPDADADAADAGAPAAPPPKIRTAVAEGLRYVWHHPLLRPIAGSTATFNLFGSMSGAVIVVFAVRELDMTAGHIGAVTAVGNVGFLVGAALSARITARLGVGRTIMWSGLVSGLGGWLAPLATPATATPVLVASLAIVVVGVPPYNINQVSLRQAITPDRLQGRLHATMRFLVWGTMPVGALLGGVLGTLVGLRATLAIGAAGTSLAFLWVALSPVRSISTIPDGPASVGEELGDAAPGVGGVVGPMSGPGGVVHEPVLGVGVDDDLDVR